MVVRFTVMDREPITPIGEDSRRDAARRDEGDARIGSNGRAEVSGGVAVVAAVVAVALLR